MQTFTNIAIKQKQRKGAQYCGQLQLFTFRVLCEVVAGGYVFLVSFISPRVFSLSLFLEFISQQSYVHHESRVFLQPVYKHFIRHSVTLEALMKLLKPSLEDLIGA